MMSIVTTVDNEFLENFHLLYNEKHDNNTLKFYCCEWYNKTYRIGQ